jgi:succinate-semialdehyde dehydrogenase / glutarate-semialdehyde dehydrogenase
MSRLLINGEWVPGQGTESILDKYSREPFGEMATASPEQVAAAVSGVRSGFETSKLSPFDRFRILSSAADIVKSRGEALVKTMIKETGFTRTECEQEVRRTEQTLMLCAEEAKRITGEMIPTEATPGLRNRMGFTIRVPLGVVCAITPFNSPLNTVAHKLGPALAAGNSVILKPATYTPFSAVQLCEALLDAGLPPSLLALVQGQGATIGRALLADQRIDFYTFTGSTSVGLEVQKAARLRGTQLELGSIASTILCHDADMDIALPKIAAACFRKAGQVCTSTQRLLADRRIADEFIDRFVDAARAVKIGDPSDPGTTVGPMISLAEAQRAESWVSEAVDQGAELLAGGMLHGSVMEPTILRNIDDKMRVVSEEIFAPVVSVIAYDDFKEALDYANGTSYGLAAGVFTSNLHTAFKAARQLRFGGIHINETSSSRLDVMPFGGVKDSGYGHEGPYYAIREMSEERLVTVSF